MAFDHLLPHQNARCIAFKPLEKAFRASLDSLVIIVVLGFDDEQAWLSYHENLETNCQQGFRLDSLSKTTERKACPTAHWTEAKGFT